MGRPPQSLSRDTRRALLDAGLELFAEKGYFGTSLRDIAKAVGVRESALYHYFQSKEALFQAILDEQREPGGEHAALLEAPVDDVAQLLERLGLELLARFATLRERKLYRILMSDGVRLAAEGRINLLERMSTGARFMRQLMERLVREGHLAKAPKEFLAAEFFAPFALWRQVHAARPDDPLVADPKAFVRQHVQHFLRGAAPPARKAGGRTAI